MPRLRKLRKKQKFQYNVNRRRLNKKMKKLPKINCDAVREAWDDKKSISGNLAAMGLVADANKMFGDSSRKVAIPTEVDGETSELAKVATKLQQEAREGFQKKKEVAHPLPPEQYRKLCKFIDKHGEDYEAMAKDHSNYYQETPKQLQKQIERLKKIPQQWIPFLKSRGLITS